MEVVHRISQNDVARSHGPVGHKSLDSVPYFTHMESIDQSDEGW